MFDPIGFGAITIASHSVSIGHGERLDTGKAGAAIGADQLLATVAAINGAEVGRG